MLIDLKTRIDNIDYELRTITAKQAAEEITLNKGMLVDVREPSEVANQLNQRCCKHTKRRA